MATASVSRWVAISRLLAFFAAASLGGCWEGTSVNVRATVLAAHGLVQLKEAHADGVVPMGLGNRPGPGDSLQTSARSDLSLALLPNALIQLRSETELQIDALVLVKDGNETDDPMRRRSAQVTLRRGLIFVSHEKHGAASTALQVATPQAEIVANAYALFVVESRQDLTRITCASGTLEIHPRGTQSRHSLSQGFVAVCSGGESKIVSTETDVKGQAEAIDSVAVERQLRALRRPLRWAPPPK